MNHVYRLVFNRSLGVMQVASELASSCTGGQGEPASSRNPKRATLASALGITLMLAGGTAMAQTVTWTGQINGGSANVASNWSSGAIPGASNDVVMNLLNAHPSLPFGITHTYGSLSISNGANYDVNGSLTVRGLTTISGPGHLFIAGTMNAEGGGHQQRLEHQLA